MGSGERKAINPVAHGRTVSAEPWAGRVIGQLSLMSSARPRATTAIILAMTFVVGFGMVHLETDADLLRILPKDDPHTLAAQNASQEFRGFYDFVEVMYGIDAAKCNAVRDAKLPDFFDPRNGQLVTRDCGNVTDEAYVRGMEEVWQFFQTEMPEAQYSIDLAGIIKTVNWTNSGFDPQDPQAFLEPLVSGEPDRLGKPNPDAYSMPGIDEAGRFQYQAAWQGANAADDQVNDVVAKTFKAGRTLLFFNTGDTQESRVAVGRAVYETVDKYAAEVQACDDDDATTPCTLQWNVFDAQDGLAVRGVSALDAHASDVTRDDITLLAPFIITGIIFVLYVAFMDIRVILVAALNLLTAFVWTAGMMGWLKIPFSALNMTIVPLILGVGIDYGIHMVSEYLEHKGDGDRNRVAFAKAGRRAGLAMAIATITTVCGLMLMTASPSVLMAQLGIVSSIALIVTFLFTVTLVPAVLTLTSRNRRARRHRGSTFVQAVAQTVGRHRAAAIFIVVLLTAGGLAGMQRLEPEPFGNPQLNYPEGDRVRDDADTISRLFFGGETNTQSNYLILEGDMTDPGAHVYVDVLMEKLETHPDLEGFSTASFTRIVRAWLAIEQGTPKALAYLANDELPPEAGTHDFEYPQTQQEIEETFDEIFASPFASFMTILLDPDYELAMVPFDTHQDLSFDEVERIWAATQQVIRETEEETGYTGLSVHLFGNNAFSYLFITKEQPWVNNIAYLSFGLVVVMIAALTRNVRATACVASIMITTGVWWLGLLPLMGLGLSVGLMLPMVFIMAIGSDDAIHLIWNMEQTRDRNRVYRFVGKAVLLTSVTTLVAFSIFSLQTDLLVRRTLLATAVSVVVMWLATMLVVPCFYPPGSTRPVRPRTRPAPTQTAMMAQVQKKR